MLIDKGWNSRLGDFGLHLHIGNQIEGRILVLVVEVVGALGNLGTIDRCVRGRLVVGGRASAMARVRWKARGRQFCRG